MNKFPIRIPVSKSIIATTVLFTLFAGIIAYGIVFLLTNTILMDDEPMPFGLKLIFAVLFSVVEIGILNMVIRLWVRIFGKKGAMTLTSRGIEDTFMIFTVFAFWTVLPIRCIPWEAISEFGKEENMLLVDASKLSSENAGFFARIMLRFGGFSARVGKITEQEIFELRNTMLQEETQ